METSFNVMPYAAIPSEDWENAANKAKKEAHSEPDDIIQAWEAGIDRGINETERVLVKHFQANLHEISEITEKFYSELKSEIDLTPVNAFLRVNSISSFDILFVVDLEKYITGNRKTAYQRARDLRSEFCKGSDIKIDISFMADSSNFNPKMVNAEGFTFKYAPKSSQA